MGKPILFTGSPMQISLPGHIKLAGIYSTKDTLSVVYPENIQCHNNVLISAQYFLHIYFCTVYFTNLNVSAD